MATDTDPVTSTNLRTREDYFGFQIPFFNPNPCPSV